MTTSLNSIRIRCFDHRRSTINLGLAFACLVGPVTAQAECLSAQPHISDAWCQAVQCAPVYVQGGFCIAEDRPIEDSVRLDPADEADDAQEAEDASDVEEVSAVIDAAARDDVQDATHLSDLEDTTDLSDTPANPDLSAEADCVSQQPNISDAWCRAVACHPTYIESGHCIRLGQPQGEDDKGDTLIGEADIDKSEPDQKGVVGPLTNVSNPMVEGADNDGDDGADDAQDNGVNTTTDGETEDFSPADEAEPSDEVNVATFTRDECPPNWRRVRKDCSNLPWQNSVRWHCSQQLPPSTTQLCGADEMDFTDEICTSRTGYLSAEWCINPSPTKVLVCGGTDCGVAAASNECLLIPTGGRGSVAQVCPN